jgi:hypothetical protein
VILTLQPGHQRVKRNLLADTGAGPARAPFELLLAELDCRLAGGKPAEPVVLGGAYAGLFPVYRVQMEIPELAFRRSIRVGGVPTVPAGFGGIAGFRFLNRFTYGNFGDPTRFGLET